MKFKNNIKLEIIICIIGLLLISYPYISDYINSKNTSKVIEQYEEKESNKDYKEEIKKIKEYNESLLYRKNQFKLDKEQKEKYNSLLNIDGKGYIGYITIDKIDVKLPIYHGTDEMTLSKNVGHLEWSSLPIGGLGTHAVLSAHTGQANNRLFSDLRKLEVKDIFVIHVLNQELIYEVEEIKTVKPNNNNDLYIDKNKDLVTLFTCTPYGVNTNRLLVRGHRVEKEIEHKESTPYTGKEKLNIKKYIIISIIIIIIISIIIIIIKKVR